MPDESHRPSLVLEGSDSYNNCPKPLASIERQSHSPLEAINSASKTAPNKRQRLLSPIMDSMDVAPSNDDDISDGSCSDWGDWADAMQEQGGGSPRASASVASAESLRSSDGRCTAEKAREDAWVRNMMDQGTDGSVVQDADSKAWDYVLEMAVAEDHDSQQERLGEWNAAEVKGAAAVEFVGRWLAGHLPLALSVLAAFRRVVDAHPQPTLQEPECWAVVDRISSPSSLATISRFPEQSTHRMTLFSLNAHAGAALASAIIQPNAAGLRARRSQRSSKALALSPRGEGAWSSGDGEATRGGNGGGIVMESLDSRILEGALVSAMGRLGLSVSYRSRSGLWSLPDGATLAVPKRTELHGEVVPLSAGDTAFVVASMMSSHLRWPGHDSAVSKEARVQAIIRRSPCLGVKMGRDLVAWCLPFDNATAGALVVARTPALEADRRITNLFGQEQQASDERARSSLVATLVSALLLGGAGAPVFEHLPNRHDPSIAEAGEGVRAPVPPHAGASLRGVVLDEGSPFGSLLRAMGLERVCDADWLRFEPVAPRGEELAPLDGDVVSVSEILLSA